MKQLTLHAALATAALATALWISLPAPDAAPGAADPPALNARP